MGQTILFGLQIAYFPSYVTMFVPGFVAWRCRWLDDIPDRAYGFARLLSGQRRLSRASATCQPWASASYIAYIGQPLAIVAVAIALQGAPLPALVKFAIVGATSIAASFLIARMLPLVPVIRTVIG